MGSGRFGKFGGRYVPDTLFSALVELESVYKKIYRTKPFRSELNSLLRDYVGRPTPLFLAKNISKELGIRLYLKREDLCHTGAHKINNALGQVLLAKKINKQRIIAETGAGQHGVATATACALMGLQCVIYMGEEDVQRQSLNVYRMKLLGATVIPVSSGSRTLKDATTEAIRDWLENVENSHYIIGSVVGPHPYPTIVRDFQSIIGIEARRQILKLEQRLPHYVVACVGGGSNAMGIFYPFRDDMDVKLVAVEAAGNGVDSGQHSAALFAGSPGVLHGSMSYLLQDSDGQIKVAHSISAGLDYPGVGPELSFMKDSGRIILEAVTDSEALSGCHWATRSEGILPALETSHAFSALKKISFSKNDLVILNVSGRGDKDINTIINHDI